MNRGDNTRVYGLIIVGAMTALDGVSGAVYNALVRVSRGHKVGNYARTLRAQFWWVIQYSGAGRPHVMTHISPNCDIKHISVTIWGMISLSYGRLDVTGEVAV